jgi:molybdate transport system permease protein
VLGGVLALFLLSVLLVLLGNVWYLLANAQGEGGWRVFVRALRDPEVHFAIRLSMTTAGITMVLSMFVAIPAAYVLSRHEFFGKGLVDTLLDLPIVVPPPVIGMSLLLLFSPYVPIGPFLNSATPAWFVAACNKLLTLMAGSEISDTARWSLSTRGIILAQFFAACSFGVRAMKATFDTLGRRHEDVARTLGCTRRQAFFRVVLPMAAGGILAGAVMTWARAIAEFGPILFFCGSTRLKTEVMPVAMFLLNSEGDIERSVALVIIMILISALTLLTFKKLGGKGYLW